MRAEAFAAVDWTPSPSAAAASLREAGEDDLVFFAGDDTVVDDPYGFADADDAEQRHAETDVVADLERHDPRDDEDARHDELDDSDELVETLVLLSGRSNPLARTHKPASLPGFRPPPDLDARPRASASLTDVMETPLATVVTLAAPQTPVPWWTRPRAHWFFGGCAFVLSGLLWAVFAWFFYHRS